MSPSVRAASPLLLATLLLAMFLLMMFLAGALVAFPALPAHAQEELPKVAFVVDDFDEFNNRRVTEGEELTLHLERRGPTTSSLTVRVHTEEPISPFVTCDAPNSCDNPTELYRYATFSVGSSTTTLTFLVEDDGELEDDTDYLLATVSPEAGSDYRQGFVFQENVFIDDPPPMISIFADQTEVVEGAAAAFTVTRTGPTTDELVVDAAVSDPGAFLRGNHWQPTPTPQFAVTFAAGSATAAVSLQTIDDWRDIPDNDVTVTIVPPTGYRVASPGSASVTVTDNDVAPELELVVTEEDAEIVEGENLRFTVRRHGGSANLVLFALDRGFEGEIETEYVVLEAEADASLSWDIPTDDNDRDEADRVYRITLVPEIPEAADEYWTVRGSPTATITVGDNDLPLVWVEAESAERREGEYVRFRLRREGVTTDRLGIRVEYTQLTSVREDLATSVSTGIPAGQHRRTDNHLAARDGLDEPSGSLTISVVPDAAYRIDPDRASASTRIIDVDPDPVLTVDDVTVAEDAGTAEIVVRFVDETVPSAKTVRVNYYPSVGGTASFQDPDGPDGPGVPDYTLTSGALIFEPRVTRQTISVQINDDSLLEQNETFHVSLNVPKNATLLDGRGSIVATGTITDNEPAISIAALAEAVTEGEPAVFQLTRTGDASNALTVNVLVLQPVNAGAAIPSTQVSVEFPAGESSVTWNVPTVDDEVDEPAGQLTVVLFGPGELGLPLTYRLASPSLASVTVNDNDLPTVTIEAVHGDRVEGQDLEFTLRRDGDLSVPLTVNVSVTGGDDFITGDRPGTVAFTMGDATASLRLTTANDSPVQDTGTVYAAITAGSGYHAGDPSSAGVVVFDTELVTPQVSISANQWSVTEGEDVVFTLTRTGGHLDQPLTVGVRLAERKTRFKTDKISADVEAYWVDETVEFEPSSRTVTLTQPTVDETLHDGNSTMETEIRLGPYAIVSPRTALTWVRDDDVPTVTIHSAAGERIPGTIYIETTVILEDGTRILPTANRTGFEEILEDDNAYLGIAVSRTGDTSYSLWIRQNGYTLQWTSYGLQQVGGAIEIDEEIGSWVHYDFYGDFTIPEGSEEDYLVPGYKTHDTGPIYGSPIRARETSTFLPRLPFNVTPLGGLAYFKIVPFYCETIPGDCGYEPQYHIGTAASARYVILNDAQGVRVEASQESVRGRGHHLHPAPLRKHQSKQGSSS